MKKIIFLLTIGTLIGCNSKVEKAPEAQSPEIAVNYAAFGDTITDAEVLSEKEMAEKFHSLKPGDTIDVKFSSKVKEVCQKKGCWMKLDLEGDDAMITFKDYAYFMPYDLAGKDVIVGGKAYVEEMSVEDQRHYAEDAGKTPEEIAQITEPKITYAFKANGVLIPQENKE